MTTRSSEQLVIDLKLRPDMATVRMPFSIGDGPPRERVEFPLYELLGIEPPKATESSDDRRDG